MIMIPQVTASEKGRYHYVNLRICLQYAEL